MRVKTFALMIAAIVLCAVSLAQGSSNIDNCCSVNRQCATNREWVAGYHAFQRNECPAGQSAAPASAPVSAPVGQPIDNCCYVNRQCATDQQWVDGYWAYQNGQCAAPAQVQPAPSAQPAASAPANVDNCCFLDRQCHSDDEWENGYWAYQNNECPAAPASVQTASVAPSRPRIEGSSRFVRLIARSLNLLRDKAPEWYTYVISAMDTIDEIPNSDPDAETCSALAFKSFRRVGIETCYAFPRNIGRGAPIIMAGTLAHEACHLHTYQAGIVYPGGGAQEEFECVPPMEAVYKLLDPNGLGARVTTADEWYRALNFLCSKGDEASCQMAELVHLYYD
ncbi:MAG: hypothetical protein OXG85_12445 [Chloroflexi bacterium]|nr:hypothetical protein [Chloroflexota bacterium]